MSNEVKIVGAEPFDRDAYAEALEDVNRAINIFRHARGAVAVLRQAGELHHIEPFNRIAANYHLLSTATPTLDQLESVAYDAASYYPVGA